MPTIERKHDSARDAERLTELRLLHGRTQQECGDALGIGQPSYAKMESGATPLRRRDKVTLAVLYELKVADAFPD